MSSEQPYFVVLVTAPDVEAARKLAAATLEPRLVACANIITGVESHYWWQDKLESASETLIIFKTAKDCLADLEKVILANHPYDTPEFIAIPINSGNARYLSWIRRETARKTL